VYGWLATVLVVMSLVVAAWCFVAAARDRFIDRSHLVGLALVELGLLLQVVVAAVRIVGGERPVELVAFIGYVAMAALMVPAAVVVALLERTRYGSVIAGAGSLVLAVLVLRLHQLWTPLQ
jgi:hypothetical protein